MEDKKRVITIISATINSKNSFLTFKTVINQIILFNLK